MLFAILKALGLDIPARINALRADLDQRVEATSSQVSQVAQQAAVLAVLFVLAAMAAFLAFGVALVAIFWWVAVTYGVLAGLAVDFIILVLAAAILAMMARARSKSLAVNAAKAPRALLGATAAASNAGVAGQESAVAPPAVSAGPAAQSASASDLAAPLAVLLATLASGRPRSAELLGNLRATAVGSANTALDRAANVVRAGDRTNLLAVLAGAAFVGWLLTRQSGR